MITNTSSDVLKASMDFRSRRHSTSLQHWSRTEFLFGSEVPFNHPVNGPFPLWVRGAENLVQHMQVNSKSLNVVLDGSESKIDEVDAFIFDQNVIG